MAYLLADYGLSAVFVKSGFTRNVFLLGLIRPHYKTMMILCAIVVWLNSLFDLHGSGIVLKIH